MLSHLSSLPDQFTQVGNILFFAATSAQGRELWKTDGNTSGTQLVRDLSTGDEEQYDNSFGFSEFLDAEFPPSAPAFNRTNPTRVGYGSPRELSECNGRLYYVRSRLGFPGQIWEYNPATESHREVTSLGRGVANPAQLTVSDGRLYFVGDDGDGQKLFVYERLPLIKEHPASQTLLAGGSATLGVVTYDPTVTYSWRRGVGTGVPVGVGPTLSVNASNVTIQPYLVRVTNGREGSQRSGNAYIRVLDEILSAQIRNFPESWWAQSGVELGNTSSATPGTLDISWGTSNMVNW
jgi:ELWxxDGT repeat protein